MKKSTFLTILVLLLCFLPAGRARAEKYAADYETTIYGTDDGLDSLEINAIAQTPDGYLWVGSYSGLYQYDGSAFHSVTLDSRLTSIMALYTDSSGRLWIGTNDNGVAVYTPRTKKLKLYNTDNGLSSNAIRSILEDEQGNIYIGTVNALSVISPSDTVYSFDSLTDIVCVKDMCVGKNNTIAGITNSGVLFFLRNNHLIFSETFTQKEGVYFNSIFYMENGSYLLGTSGDTIYKYRLIDSHSKLEPFCRTKNIYNANKIVDDGYGGVFLCSENGYGHIDASGRFEDFTNSDFSSSFCNALIDDQRNIWFVSNKQGICKLSLNPFQDYFAEIGLDKHVVNAILISLNEMYIGCDDGLYIVDTMTNKQIHYDFQKRLKGVRIRHLMKDSYSRIWISTYGNDGLLCIDPHHRTTWYNETDGTMGGRFRFTMELSDGTILAASSTGLTYIRNGKVTHTIGKQDGLHVPQILTAIEQQNGTILAGSDGDGIYVIKDGKIQRNIGMQDGLNSLVILRIVPCSKGYLYITSNALYYADTKGRIRHLDQFPYTNNYDAYLTKNGKFWISSSAGIYVVNKDDLIANKDYRYTLLNKNHGFDTTLTANAWNYIDPSDNMYLCCSTGIRKISITNYNNFKYNYHVAIAGVQDGENTALAIRDGVCEIPATTNRFTITAAVLNFTLQNPLVHMYLEGFDDHGVTVSQSDMKDMTFTNLPHGNYTFHLEILNSDTMEVQKSVTLDIRKKAHYYENTYFQLLICLAIFGIIVIVTWTVAKLGSLSLIKRQYREIRAAKDAADQANRAKSLFLANMSHEIRTPINTIMGMDELILRQDISPLLEKYARNIKQASTSLLSIVNDILDFSKIESGKMHIVEEEYRLADVLRELVTMISVRAQEKNLNLVTNFDPEIPRVLIGDDVRLRQILLNLLSNAVKYTNKGIIAFGVRVIYKDMENVRIHFWVKDTGIGIRPDDMDKIFTTFERLDEQKNAHIEGTGLGLNITKDLLALMNSRLEVESVYGEGSNFHFSLVQKVKDIERMGDFQLESAAEKKKERYTPLFTAPDAHVLVVDDNSMNLALMKALLKPTLLQVDTASSGAACLRAAAEKHYDLILLDHMMPEMDGIETLAKLRSEPNQCSDVPIIVLTANAVAGAKEMYLKEGFSDYLSKPVTGKALEEMLAAYLPDALIRQETPVNEPSTQTDPAPSAEAGSNEPLLDRAAGLELSGGQEDLYHMLLDLFVELAEEKEPQLNELAEEKDWKNYQLQIHGLKGSCLNIGARRLAQQAQALEDAASRGDEDYIQKHHAAAMETYRALVQTLRD